MRPIYSRCRSFLTDTILIAAVMAGISVNAADADLVPLPLQLPLPTLKGTPEDLPRSPSIDAPAEKPPPPLMAPKGARNVALNKKVTASDKNPITGEPSQITDGKKEAYDQEVRSEERRVGKECRSRWSP